jgi:hypothetical protein
VSQKAAADFVGRLAIDATLRQELVTSLAGATDLTEYLARFSRFAGERGFEASPEELMPYVATADNGRDLTDKDLAKVAGGVGVFQPQARQLTGPGEGPSIRVPAMPHTHC